MEKLQAIYEPKGRAGEYAKLAVNLYRGCSHGCVYCYAPQVTHMDRSEFHSQCVERSGILNKLRHDAKLIAARSDNSMLNPVLFCFTSDPYQPGASITRQALSIMREFNIPFSVLTKGAMAWPDFDLYGPHDLFGVTLTCDNYKDSKRWEPHAAMLGERTGSLLQAHYRGIRTWVSLEPVIYPEQTLALISLTHNYVNHYKVGKLNYHPRSGEIDWHKFALDVKAKLESVGADYYMKEDLRSFL